MERTGHQDIHPETSSFSHCWYSSVLVCLLMSELILRVSGAVCTSQVLTTWTDFGPSWKQRRALMTSPPYSLHRTFSHQWLSTRLVRFGQDDVLSRSIIIVNLDVSCHNNRQFIPSRLLDTFITFWRKPWTFSASTMSTSRTLFSPSKCCIASVAYPMNTHTNWFLDPIYCLLRPGECPFTWLDWQLKAFT